MTLARQPRPISADQAEFVIRHGVPSFSRPLHAERSARTKVPRGQHFLCRMTVASRESVRRPSGLRLASRRFRRGSLRLPIEEQGLADYRLDRIRAEGLGDQECRLGRLPGEKALGKSGYENNRHFLSSQNFVDRVEPRASVGKLNVGKNEAWTALERCAHRLSMSSSDRRDVVAQLLNERLYVEGYERFILDDQHCRTNLFGNFPSRALNEASRRIRRAINGLRDLLRAKRLHGAEQEGDARLKRDRGEVPVCAAFIAKSREIDLTVEGYIAPTAQKQLVEGDFRIEFRVETIRVGQNRLERGRDISVARRLRPAQRARKPTQEGNMRRNRVRDRHVVPPRHLDVRMALEI